MLNISMPRGDIKNISISITSDDEPYVDLDEIYFTVKKNYNEKEALFQKKLSNGTITRDGNKFLFRILPDDTESLKYGDYVFDVELVKGNSIKQTTVGKLRITNEVTFSENE